MKYLGLLLLALTFSVPSTRADEPLKSDLNAAGQNTSNAAKEAGSDISNGAQHFGNEASTTAKKAKKKTQESASDVKNDVSSG